MIRDFLEQRVFAVVGVSREPGKYGNIIFKYLLEHGYKAYPVNPKAAVVAGRRCYPDLDSLPERPGMVDIAVPPEVSLGIVRDCKMLGISRVWFQPGSESPEAIAYCKKNGLKEIHGKCVMAEIGKHG